MECWWWIKESQAEKKSSLQCGGTAVDILYLMQMEQAVAGEGVVF